jgi:hypothetical protein
MRIARTALVCAPVAAPAATAVGHPPAAPHGEHELAGGAHTEHQLHAWVWKRNPAGTFAMWNSRVECPEEPR